MKIGKFSKENDISIDTTRYYIGEGLLLPEKAGAQYDFDKRCMDDMKRIKNLKEMGYSISEIALFLSFFRLGKISSSQEDEFYKEFYESKLAKNHEMIKNLNEQNCRIEESISEIDKKPSKKERTIGINLNSLKLLGCPVCDKELKVTDGKIEDNHVVSGKLICSCGIDYLIENGIILSSNIRGKAMKVFDIADYIEDLSFGYLKNISNSLEWLYKKIDPINLKNEVIVDLGSGTGFLLRYIFDDIPKSAVYIVVDHDINRQIFLRNLIKKASKDVNVLFICSDFKEMPLMKNSIDVVIDYAGSSNYGFENTDFLLRSIDGYFKRNISLFSISFMFEKYGLESLIDEKYRRNFDEKVTRKNIQELGYNILEEQSSPSVNEGSLKYENYFKSDEKVYIYRIYAKRE